MRGRVGASYAYYMKHQDVRCIGVVCSMNTSTTLQNVHQSGGWLGGGGCHLIVLLVIYRIGSIL